MANAAPPVQSASANTTTTPATVTLPAVPTVGNTLLAVMMSDTTATAVPTAGSGRTFVEQDSQAANAGWYVWTRLVTSGDTAAVSFTPNGANPAALMVIEVQGTFDKKSTRVHVTSSAAATSVVTGLTPANADCIIFAIAGLHGTTAVLSGGSANNGFTLGQVQFAPTSGSTISSIVTAYKLPASTAATGTTTLSWTGNATDRDGVQVAFTAVAGPVSNPLPELVMAPIRR